jgi:hypothetical protein
MRVMLNGCSDNKKPIKALFDISIGESEVYAANLQRRWVTECLAQVSFYVVLRGQVQLLE